MRIIAGKHRALKLAPVCGGVRPTPDRVKESLFQILSERIRGARVLDLFAGSGALGLESLSRGAAEAVFNDISADSLAVVKKNLAAAGEKGTLLNRSYETCLKTVGGKFDLIFCDPPYSEHYTDEILRLIAERDLLNADGLAVCESEREELPPLGWRLFDRRTYGRVKIFLFQRSEP